MLFNGNLSTRCHKTSLRAFISWCAYSIGAPILKPEMWADTNGKTIITLCMAKELTLKLYWVFVTMQLPHKQLQRASFYKILDISTTLEKHQYWLPLPTMMEPTKGFSLPERALHLKLQPESIAISLNKEDLFHEKLNWCWNFKDQMIDFVWYPGMKTKVQNFDWFSSVRDDAFGSGSWSKRSPPSRYPNMPEKYLHQCVELRYFSKSAGVADLSEPVLIAMCHSDSFLKWTQTSQFVPI